ncbi:MAG TPA: carbon storage regulator [Bryobacteraceae bacterium]|jgi:carbon storage regulator|nr:carbon storage regulator [Bryobacteraceae bacterium]
MLVIRRRAGEALLVGDGVELEILEISGGQVKLGVRAPREIVVLRKEVKITEDENRAASQSLAPGTFPEFVPQEDSKKR